MGRSIIKEPPAQSFPPAASGRGIGTLGEKTLHTALKRYIEPDCSWHEVKIGPYVADIMTDTGVTEIQTRGFSNLRKKLEYLLERCRVTVVYPVPHEKWISWIDPDTGEVSAKRKSPKAGTPAEIFRELVHIKYLLKEPNLTLRVLLVDMEETRFLNGWSRDRKHGSERCDRVPLRIVGDVTVESPRDYLRLIPDSLPQRFTSSDFSRAAHISLSAAQGALNILYHIGAAARVGRDGRRYVYERSVPAEV